ncbi:hypothetical protein C7N43_03220 [Sphingobacteriales bacterium UPWRP_1]|nr:hypothetical protein BVG80_08620 [Sphingobacteriales bacterium TSM_CSM]PSJ78490.1 hypothetical protein C7N43_03220 [Sphingobacteriales bacterium UPWRP_1]
MDNNTIAANIFRTLNIVFLGMTMGQVIMFALFFNLRQNNLGLHLPFQYVALAAVVGAILGAPWLYSRLLTSYQNGANLPFGNKMRAYFSANLVKLAVLEAAALSCLVFLFLTGQLYYAYLFLAVFFAFLLHRPKPVKCAEDLQLNDEERMYLPR